MHPFLRYYRWRTWALGVSVVALYILAINPYWRFQRDSALYMGLARSLAQAGSYTFNGRPHVLASPGFPAILSVIYRTLGENFLAMNVLIKLFGLGSIALAWLLAKELELPSYLATAFGLLFTFSRTLYYYSTHILPMVPFTFFALAGLYCGARMLRSEGPKCWRWCAGAMAAAFGALSLWPLGPALLAALVGALWFQRGRSWQSKLGMSLLLVVPLGVAAALWMWRCAAVRTAATEPTYLEAFITRSGGLARTGLHVVSSLSKLLNETPDALLGVGLGLPIGLLIAVPTGVGLLAALHRGERLLSLYGIIFLIGICVGGRPGRRYLLPALPVLLYWLMLGAAVLEKTATEKLRLLSPQSVKRIGLALLLLALGLNLARIGRVAYESRAPDFYARIEEGRLPSYFALANWLKYIRPTPLVAAYEDRVVHYLSGARTVRLHKGWGKQTVRETAAFIYSANVNYIILDAERKDGYKTIEELRRIWPKAFKEVRQFGKLQVLQVHRGRFLS